MEELKLWSVPEMKGKLSIHAGKQLIELINRDLEVVDWCIRKQGWVLNKEALQYLNEMKKPTSKGFQGRANNYRPTKHY